MGNIHTVMQIAPVLALQGAALRVRPEAVARFAERLRSAPPPSYITSLRATPELMLPNVNVGRTWIHDAERTVTYLVVLGGGKWGYDDEFAAYLRGMAELLDDARFFIQDEVVEYIEEYAIADGTLTVTRVAEADGDLIAHIEPLLRSDPARASTLAIHLAEEAARDDDPAGALSWLDRAIRARATVWQAHHLRASVLAGLGRHEEAIACLAQARASLGPFRLKTWGTSSDPACEVEDDPDELVGLALRKIECLLADCHAALGRIEAACAAYDRAHALTPRGGHSAAITAKGALLLGRGDHDAARACFTQAMKLASDRQAIGAIAYLRACLAAATGDHDAGLCHLALAIELHGRRAREAAADPRLAALHAMPRFQALIQR